MSYARPKGSGVRSDELRFRVKPLRASLDAPDALPAKGCRCEERGNTSWLERDEDGQLHCTNCGSDYRP